LRLPTSVRSVLFVCKGNICRSPLAAVYFQLLVEKAGTDMVVRSAGLETTSGKPAHFNAKSVALEHQFSLDVHSTTQVHADLLNQSDLIIVFELVQRDRLHRLYRNTRGKVVLLGRFDSEGPIEIADPFSGTIETFRSCFQQVSRCCDALAGRLSLKSDASFSYSMFTDLSGKSRITEDGQAKVLHLSTSSGPGGAERVISTLAQALNDDRFRVIVGLFKSGWLQTECERLGVETRVIPLKGTFHRQWFRNCFRLVREERIALVHGHEFSAIVYGWIISLLAGIPFVGTVHGKNYFWQKLRRRLAFRTISRFGQLVAVSEDLKAFIVKTVGIPASRVQVIYNGVECCSPPSDPEIDRCRAELGLSAGDLIIGTVGNLYPVKGHRCLLDAMATILRRYPNAVLLLIGRGELEISLKEQTQRLGIEERVRFLGMRQDVPKLLAVMDIFVLPSLSEGLSMALLEAMASGKPVVATRVGGNPELIDHGRTGFLVQPEDVSDLAANLLKLLSDPEKIKQFGQQAAERVRQQLSMRQMVVWYKDLYARSLTVHNSGMKNK